MTKEDAKRFINEVLTALWPRWTPKDYEIDVWVNKLAYYDYEAAKKATNNAFFGEERRGNLPPAGKIIQALRTISQLGQNKGQGPVLLYTVIKERHYLDGKRPPFFGSRIFGKTRSQPELERNAELMRGKYNQLYGENHIVIRDGELNDIPF